MLETRFLHKQTRRRIKLGRYNGGGAYETFARVRHIRCQNRAHNRLKRQSLCRACASTFMMRLQHARDMKRAAGASDRGPFRLHCPAKLLGGATAEQPLTRTTRADKISVLTGTGVIKFALTRQLIFSCIRSQVWHLDWTIEHRALIVRATMPQHHHRVSAGADGIVGFLDNQSGLGIAVICSQLLKPRFVSALEYF